MGDDYGKELLLRRALYQQQRRAEQARRRREAGARSPIQPLYYVARNAGSGEVVLIDRQGNQVRREIITNSQQLPGQRMLAFGNIASQMPAPYPIEVEQSRRPQSFEFGQAVYLVESVYDVEKEAAASCEIPQLADLIIFTRIQKAVWQGGGACPVTPPPPPPGPPATPPPPPPPPLRPPYTYCEKNWRQVYANGELIALAAEESAFDKYGPFFWATPGISYNVRYGVEGYTYARYISRQKLAADPGIKTWFSEYNKAIGRGDLSTANVYRNLLDAACDLTIHAGTQTWYPNGTANIPSHLQGYVVTSPPSPLGGAWQLVREDCYEVRDTYVPVVETGSPPLDDPGDEPNGDTYTRIISIGGPFYPPIELTRMRMSEPFSIEYSIANDKDGDRADWYFKIHAGTKSNGSWCSTRYIYIRDFRLQQSIAYAFPGPLLPVSKEAQVIKFEALNSTTVISVATVNYNLRTINQKLDITYSSDNQQLKQQSLIYNLIIPATENDYEVRKHVGVWIPGSLVQQF